MATKRALFFDLDSSLIVTISGDTFPRDCDDWQFNRHVLQGVGQYIAEGFILVIVTNQGGIEAGYHTDREISNKLVNVIVLVEQTLGVTEAADQKTAFYYCPSLSKEHPDRKPNPGMLLKAASDLDLDLGGSLMIGDMESDRLAAQAAGVSYMDINEFLRTHPESMKLPGNTALVAIRNEADKAQPDLARIKELMPQVKPGTMDSALFDKVTALYGAELAAQQPEKI